MLRKYGISVDLNLYSVFDQLPQGVTIQDKESKLVYANTRAAQLVGCNTVEDFLNTPIEMILANFTLMSPNGSPLSPLDLPARKALETQTLQELTVRFLMKKTGKEYWSLIKSQPLYNEQKQITGVMSIFDDLTKIKRAENEYKFLSQVSAVMSKSFSYESRLESFAKLVVPTFADWCAIDILDTHGAAQRITVEHQDPQQVLLSKKIWANYPPTHKSKSGFYHILKEGKVQFFSVITDKMLEAAAQDPQHLEFLQQLNLQSVVILPLIARGKKMGVLSVGTANSGRKFTKDDLPFLKKLAERVALLADNARLYSALSREMKKQRLIKNELEKSEEKFESIFHTNFIGMIIFSNEGRIIEANEAACELLESTQKKLAKKKIADVMHVTDSKKFNALWQSSSSNDQSHGEIEWQEDNEQGKTFEYTITPEIVPRFNLLVLRDVTDRKIEEKRREHFMGITSHELKSPLTSIKSIAQLLKKQLVQNNSEAEEYLTQIGHKVDTLTRLVNDLLDVTRIRQGKLEFLYEVIDLPKLVDEIAQEVLYSAKDWKIERKGELTQTVIVDRARLTQVLRNLLWNAVKYASQEKRITIFIAEKKRGYTIAIQDFGPGIELREQKRIFHLYYRSSEHHQGGKGLGVGLFISAEIVKQMGGELCVKSKGGQGSTFFFSLPYIPKKSSEVRGAANEKNFVN